MVHWLPHLKAGGVTPVWALEYEHLVDEELALDSLTDAVESLENGQVNGGIDDVEEELDDKGDEEEVEAEMGLDDDLDDFDFGDFLFIYFKSGLLSIEAGPHIGLYIVVRYPL